MEGRDQLSRQEERVLALARQGLGDKQIAHELSLSPDTVRTYWQRIRRKIGAGTRAEIVATISDKQTAAALKAVETEKDLLLQEILRRKSVEKALRTSEQQWRNLADSMPHMVFVSKPHGEVFYLNKRVYEYTGLTEAQLARKSWETVVHPDDLPSIVKGFELLKVGQSFPETLSRLRRHDGEYRWHYDQVVAVNDEIGQPLYWYGTSTDVHEQVLLRERLAQAQRLAKLGSFEYDFQTRLARWSPDVFEMFELPVQEGWFDGELFMQLIHPDDAAAMLEATRRSLATACDFDVIYRMRLKSGRTIWVHSLAKPVVEDQKVVRFEGTNQDITETQVYAQELREREQALASAEKVAKIGSYDWRIPEANFMWSPNMSAIFEQESMVEMRRERFLLLLHPDDRELYRSTMATTLEQGVPFDMEYRITFGDRIKWIHAVGIPTVENGVVVRLVGTCQDVTEQVEARFVFERQRMQFELAEQVAKLGSFSADYRTKKSVWTENLYRLYERDPALGPMWGDEIAQKVHPDDVPTYERERQRFLANGGVWECEFRYRLSSGDYRWFHVRVIAESAPGLPVALAIGIVQDVTDAPFGFIGA